MLCECRGLRQGEQLEIDWSANALDVDICISEWRTRPTGKSDEERKR